MLREAGWNDIDGVVRLYRQLHPDDPVVAEGTARETFERILAAPGMRLFVWEDAGRVIGTTYLNVIPNLTRAASSYAVIENVVVDQAFRRRGIGQQLMAATMQTAWDAGCYKIMLMTGSADPQTHAFYRACGFSADVKTAYLARPT